MILKSLNFKVRSVTLLELILAMALVSMVAFGFASIDMFSQRNVLGADRLAKVQNSLSYVMAHMTKNIGMAIGGVTIDADNVPIRRVNDNLIIINIDTNNNLADGSERETAYSYAPGSYELRYYSNYPTSGSELLSNMIISNLGSTYVAFSDFTSCGSGCNNYVQIRLSGRAIPAQAASPINPEVNLTTSVKMSHVSTH